MLYDLTKQSEKQFSEEYDIPFYDPLKITNAVFVGKNVTLKKDFAQTFLDYYRGDAITVDFSSKKAVDAVNAWASENTEGLISEIVREFDPGTVAAIVNAIYFSDRWEWEFNPDQTVEDAFHSPSGDTAAFFMKREGDMQVYYEDDNIQAMPLRFKTGGGMYIILPKDGDATGLLSSMTSAYFDGFLGSTISASGKLLLPRFSIESDIPFVFVLYSHTYDGGFQVLFTGVVNQP
jgi:serpin B